MVSKYNPLKKDLGYQILMHLYNNKKDEEMYGNKIKEELNSTDPHFTTTLSKLTNSKFVKKKQSVKNKRINFLKLTSIGEQLIINIIAINTMLNTK